MEHYISKLAFDAQDNKEDYLKSVLTDFGIDIPETFDISITDKYVDISNIIKIYLYM